MVNFVALNQATIDVNNITVNYVTEQSMDNQSAPADQLTLLSDNDIPSGTLVSSISIANTEIPAEGTTVELKDGTIFATPIYFNDPKSGQDTVIGVEMNNDVEG